MVVPFTKLVEAKPHSPVYLMHKFWARRPYNVFRELIEHYTRPGEVILDPFMGGGVTVVEGLQARRRVIGVDLNPLATYVTHMEVLPCDLTALLGAYDSLYQGVQPTILELYRTRCRRCEEGVFWDWMEWEGGRPLRLYYTCPRCGSRGEYPPSELDLLLVQDIDKSFPDIVRQEGLWFPQDKIPPGDKTEGLLNAGVTHFYQLFTKRNLLALARLWKVIGEVPHENARAFLRFVFSSTLKWASRQSHRRGDIIEGWAMHAYWIYPVELELNVWNIFARRFQAVLRGKRFTNTTIGEYYKRADRAEDILQGSATCLLLTCSATDLPLPSGCVDAIITDPPYGGNVNYGELSDYWLVWLRPDGKGTMVKEQEVVINRHQGKSLLEYRDLLFRAFQECFRVLKPEGVMVCTFNNKDLGVVAAFLQAAVEAGFSLHPGGVRYQPPIRLYTTTFHAKEPGSAVGDFIFTFCKENHFSEPQGILVIQTEVDRLLSKLREEITPHRHAPSEVRQALYGLLLPFLAECVKHDRGRYWEVVSHLRHRLSLLDDLVPEIRQWCRQRYGFG